MGTLVKVLNGPKYDGKYLHQLVKGILGQTRLHQALTNVVIPTFDIKNLQPVLFSSFMVLSLYLYLFIYSLFIYSLLIYLCIIIYSLRSIMFFPFGIFHLKERNLINVFDTCLDDKIYPLRFR